MDATRKYFCILLKCGRKVLEKKLVELQLSSTVADAFTVFEKDSTHVKVYSAVAEC